MSLAGMVAGTSGDQIGSQPMVDTSALPHARDVSEHDAGYVAQPLFPRYSLTYVTSARGRPPYIPGPVIVVVGLDYNASQL